MKKYVITFNQNLINDLKSLKNKIEAEGFDVISNYKFGMMVGFADNEATERLLKFKEVKNIKKYTF